MDTDLIKQLIEHDTTAYNNTTQPTKTQLNYSIVPGDDISNENIVDPEIIEYDLIKRSNSLMGSLSS